MKKKNCPNPSCTQINPQPSIQFHTYYDNGRPYLRSRCRSCCSERKIGVKPEHRKRNRGKKPYHKFKKDSCELCQFKAKYSCQLDIDHVDGNHYNNLPENLMTLCANCHRAKSWENKDHLKSYKLLT